MALINNNCASVADDNRKQRRGLTRIRADRAAPMHPFPTPHEELPSVGLQARVLPAGPWMQISGPRRDFDPTPKSGILETTLKNCPRENAPRIFENSASVLPLWGAPACRRPTKIRAGGAAGAFGKNSPAPLREIINFGRPALQNLHA